MSFDILILSIYDLDVRTSVTLNDDDATKLEAETRKSGKSFKETLNYFLRVGLTNESRPKRTRQPFKVRARALGVRPDLNYDDVWSLVD